MGKTITYPSPGSLPKDIVLSEKDKEEDALGNWSKSLYLDKVKNDEDIEFFTKKVVEDQFLILQKRPVFDTSNSDYPLNACCVPGSRKIYVTVKGDFLVCERIDGSPVIGNVSTGINKEEIKKILVDEYADNSIKECGSCWASRLCKLCYAQCYTDGKFDIDKKISHCNGARQLMLENLSFYHECLETNEKKLEYLNDIVTV